MMTQSYCDAFWQRCLCYLDTTRRELSALPVDAHPESKLTKRLGLCYHDTTRRVSQCDALRYLNRRKYPNVMRALGVDPLGHRSPVGALHTAHGERGMRIVARDLQRCAPTGAAAAAAAVVAPINTRQFLSRLRFSLPCSLYIRHPMLAIHTTPDARYAYNTRAAVLDFGRWNLNNFTVARDTVRLQYSP